MHLKKILHRSLKSNVVRPFIANRIEAWLVANRIEAWLVYHMIHEMGFGLQVL